LRYLRRRRHLASQADQEPAHVIRGDRRHVVGQAVLVQVADERENGAGVVVDGLRGLAFGFEGEREAVEQPAERVQPWPLIRRCLCVIVNV
jgi:hypothetical protein